MRSISIFDLTRPLEQDTFKCAGPSVSTMVGIFIMYYQRYKNLYKQHFSEQLFTSICLDHTFKFVSNIGYESINKKWIKQYDSILIVLTEKGFVKCFHFSKGTSSKKNTNLFKELASENSSPDYVFVYNFCSVKNILLSFFPNTSIKLDLFHAVKRLTHDMLKKHPFFIEAGKEIGLIFRESGDFGEVRKKPTPQKEIILNNLELFFDKWKSVQYKDWKLINLKVENEFLKLKVHIINGCLSGIPVGMGTNKNEALHKFLRQFGRSRLSTQTVEALVNHVLYSANTRAQGNKLSKYPLL